MPIVTDQEVRFLSQEFIKWSIVYHDNSAMIPWGHTRPQPLSRARLVWAPTELGTDFALFPNLTCPGIQSPRRCTTPIMALLFFLMIRQPPRSGHLILADSRDIR